MTFSLLCGLQKVGGGKGKVASKKKAASKFVLDCTTAETDSILDVAAFVSTPPATPQSSQRQARYLRGELLANAEAGADGFLPAEQEKYLKERIKVGGKAGNLGDVITISTDKSKITVLVSDLIYPSPTPQLLSDPALCAVS